MTKVFCTEHMSNSVFFRGRFQKCWQANRQNTFWIRCHFVVMHGTMDYFSKFYNKTPVVASVASEKTDEVEPPQGPCSTTQPTQATTHNKTPVKVDPNSTIEQELPPESDEPVTLWETKIRKSVLPCKLVWAPFYRFKGQRFCARICENDEIERDLYIQTPILDHEIVVEFIRAPKTKRLDTKLLKVEKNKLLPYYGKLDNNDAVEADHWNEGLVEKMHKVHMSRGRQNYAAAFGIHGFHACFVGHQRQVQRSQRGTHLH